MMLFYLDASAWVKYYVLESGTSWLDRFWNLGPPCACSDLGLIDVLATLARRQKQKPALGGSYDQAIRNVHQHFQVMQAIPLDAKVLARASEVARIRALRGADCIHLASAIHLRDSLTVPITLVASDGELLAAAVTEGFPTLDPSLDPPLPAVP